MGSAELIPKRISAIDWARGVALVAMAVYHFTWDLTFFGYIDTSVATTGPMRWFARTIASSFLFLVGISLVLAHGRQIRWPSFGRRLLLVAGCALLISAATWLAVRDSFVYFGILHHITVASVIGLAFIRLDWRLLVPLALLTFLAGVYLPSPFFDRPWLLWTGLNTMVRPSNDYVPIFPWFGAVLLGMAFAKSPLIRFAANLWNNGSFSGASKVLIWMGRRSLLVYMVHQPILIGLVFAATWVYPPTTIDEFAFPPDSFLDACEQTCLDTSSAEFCISYCACTDYRLQQQELKSDLLSGAIAVDDPAVVDITRQCTADIAEALQDFGESNE
ncbi:MAG: heparan-alpha-glucosaminide N-acetyltransferase [Pseudomonadota bacterium]